MLLRIAVPAGLMPADVADGWFLQLCPNGLSASSIAALFDHEHHRHQGDDQAEPGYVQCDLGGGLSTAAALAQSFEYASMPSTGWQGAALLLSPLRADPPRAYDSRAPPRRLSFSRTA